MTNSARQEKNLNRIHKKLQILTIVIQNTHKPCFDILKILTTILVSLHGGSILVILNNSIKPTYNYIYVYLFGIVFSVIPMVAFSYFSNKLLIDKHMNIICRNMIMNTIINDTYKLTKRMYSLTYISMLISFALFFGGTMGAIESHSAAL